MILAIDRDTVCNIRFIKALHIILLCVALATTGNLAASDALLTGRVVRNADGAPIAGASVRELRSQRGVYANGDGRFRLTVSGSVVRLVVRSVGYRADTVDVVVDGRDCRIALDDAPFVMPRVTVTADIGADEVIRRSVDTRNANAAKVRSVVMDLYGRKVQYGRRGFSSNDDTIPKVFQYTGQLAQRYQPTFQSHMLVTHRMSSSNVLPEQFGWIPTFEDVRRDSIMIQTEEVMGTNLYVPGPIGASALDVYSYRLVTRKQYGDAFVYVIDFQPRSRIRPGFEGTLHIVEGSYDLMYARLRTTNETFIPYLDSIELEQRYEEVASDIWFPVQSTMRLWINVRIMAGILRFASSDVFTTQALSVHINDSRADSILAAARQQKIGTTNASASGMFGAGNSTHVQTSTGADATPREYWDVLPVEPLTSNEQALLDKANTIPPRVRSERRMTDSEGAPVNEYAIVQWSSERAYLGINPSLGQTTATGFFLGARVSARYDSLRLIAESPLYNAAELRLGSVNASLSIGLTHATSIVVSAGVQSSLRTIQPSVQSLFSAFDTGLLLYGLQRDYYRSDGFQVGCGLRSGELSSSLNIERAWHIALPRYVAVRQPEVPIDPGRYTLAHVGVSYRPSTTSDLITGYQSSRIQGTLDATIGRRDGRTDFFTRVQAGMDVRSPTMATGYERSMHARIALRGGVTSAGAPQQFHLYSTPRVAAFGDFGDLMTIPLNEYIGTQHAQVVVEHNFSDYLWRSVGLPLILHRGVDIIVSYAAAQFTGSRSTQGWYHEAGVGIDGIPTFIMDHLNLRVDLRWPLSAAPPAAGRPGWCIGISTPLMQ